MFSIGVEPLSHFVGFILSKINVWVPPPVVKYFNDGVAFAYCSVAATVDLNT